VILSSQINNLLISGEAFAFCSLPVHDQPEARKVEYFKAEHGKLMNEWSDEFVVRPFDPSFSIFPQIEGGKMEHKAAVVEAIRAIRNHELEKVIISRIRHVERDPQRDPGFVFEKLMNEYPRAFVSCMYDPHLGFWMGASPELLLEKRAGVMRTVSIAGTQKISSGDNDLSHLQWDEKLQHEQHLVTDFIIAELRSIGITEIEVNGPHVLNAGAVAHLKTGFKFSTPVDADQVAELLNPTPAVCGLPRDIARQMIVQLEQHERRLYAGYLGIKRSGGDVDYYVNLRCMQVYDDHFELHLGGGITIGSDPDAEWEETENKAQVLLRVL